VNVGDVLRRLVQALDAEGISYMVAGSFASGFHGVPRSTLDVDVVVDLDRAALDRFLAHLDEATYYVDVDVARTALRERSMFNIIDLPTGWKIDIVIRKARPFSREEMSRRRLADIAGVSVYVASPEDTIVAKLEWSTQAGGSEKQRRDARDILAMHRDALDRAYIEHWVAELGLADEWAIVSAAD
jgi:hypothetical protein